MSTFPLKPTHKPVKAYFEALATFSKHGHTTEGNTRSAFADLLKKCCPTYGWHLVEEYQFKGTNKKPLRADGALVDDLTLVHGLWEAKDADDDLTKEIKRKREAGYPLTNILFQSPGHAVLYQGDRIAFNDPITTPENLVEVLELFFEHKQSHEVDWEEAVTKFAEQIPDLAKGVTTILEGEFKQNSTFRENFQSFAELCRQSINPDLSDDSIRKMLVQHLLTERIFRKVFNNQECLQRNVIAAEIEKVIHSITSRHFSRDAFLKPLDRFYTAIEKAAESQQGYTEKQHFLNAVYEKFFQRFDTKQADTHGIVYTPQPIVDFMVRSVEEILKQEFGKTISDSGVHILDPFTGTGNFITRIMQGIKRSALPHKYAQELHCNEIMLLPYYIASMNIEHAYMDAMREYKAFEGICLVDTFDTGGQGGLFSSENTERIRKQTRAPIRIVVGNPPYNMGRDSENDENQNRKYRGKGSIDSRIASTYSAASKATLRNKLSDPYVKAFRWASDRIREHGIVCFVSNNSFLDQIAFDGMRRHLRNDYSSIYILDLGGNVRHNPGISGTTHNVFGIQVGVAITVLIRKSTYADEPARILYARTETLAKRSEKYDALAEWVDVSRVSWTEILPDARENWLNTSKGDDYAELIPLGAKETRRSASQETIFCTYGLGTGTNRDAWVYASTPSQVAQTAARIIRTYNIERVAFHEARKAGSKHQLSRDETKIKWTDRLLDAIPANTPILFSDSRIKPARYRPFAARWLYSDPLLNHRPGQQQTFFPGSAVDNVALSATGIGAERPFAAFVSDAAAD